MKFRRYRLARGYWGFGFGKGAGGWYIEVLFWCWTTEPRLGK